MLSEGPATYSARRCHGILQAKSILVVFLCTPVNTHGDSVDKLAGAEDSVQGINYLSQTSYPKPRGVLKLSKIIPTEQGIGRRINLVDRIVRHYLQGLKCGSLSIEFNDGVRLEVSGIQKGPDVVMRINKPMRLIWRLLTRGDIGFAEAYIKGEWNTPELANLLYFFELNEDAISVLASASTVSRLLDRMRHKVRGNHRVGSRRNIRRHYDVGNHFYRQWLDSTMTYSCAIFDTEGESLQRAQVRKYQRILESLEASPGQHILEIGCGWGGFAELAAKQGFRVTGITLSQEQLSYARRRIANEGLEAQVDLRLQDYRDLTENFDHIVSIEMFEAVGENYWHIFFKTLTHRLKPGGRVALQTITIQDDYYESYRARPDFIQLYIFPGGMLASPSIFWAHTRRAGLIPRAFSFHGNHYARTLRCWHDRLQRKTSQLRSSDLSNSFIRMWRYYLAYCEAGFSSGRVDLMQAVMEHSPR